MVYYKWGIILVLMLVLGCATVKTTVADPQGETWTIVSKKDALVKFKTKNMEGEVDNRGKLGFVESIFGVLIMKTDIKIQNKEGD